MSIARWRLLAAGTVAFLAFAPIQQVLLAQGTITGRVTTEANQPLSGAQILAVGATATAITGEDGKYTLRNVRAGSIDVQVLHVGYKSQKKVVNVAAGSSAEVNFQLATALVQLTEIVTTATGQQRKVELGNAIATLGDVSKTVENTEVSNMSDLLIAKTPGVIVLPSPVLGGAPTIRVRGISSISLSNAPIWVVDGVRYNTTANTTAGQTPISVLNNLSPEEIEDIEIVKGPSAATLYGTNAANGVIVVTTKKGRPGAARWTYTGESRTIDDRNHYQPQFANFGKSLSTGKTVRCQLSVMTTAAFSAAQGATCSSDSLVSYNYLGDPDATFIQLGRGSLYGMNVSGGTEGLRYFSSADLDNEFGPIQMAQRDINIFQDSLHTPVSNSMFHPRQGQKMNFRTNVSAAVTPKFDLNVNAGFGKTSNIIEPDNSLIIALLYTGQSNYGYKGCPKGTENSGCGLDKPGIDPTTGYSINDANSFSPGTIMQYITTDDVQRFTGSFQANWRPLSWIQNDGTIGVDAYNQDIFHVCRLNECPNSGATARVGNVSDFKADRRNLSAKVASTASWQAKAWANLKTTIGADYTNEENDQLSAAGRTLPVGASTLAAAATFVSFSATQPTAVKTLGYYAQEQLALRDRMFLTVAARSDQNSAFGATFQRVVYPKISLSWIASDEDFFPKYNWINSFRLRSAYGANGVQPGATAALQTFTPVTSSIAVRDANTNVDLAGLVANQPGNAALKPERSAELEMGFETDLMNRRFHIDYTYYKKNTTDALISIPIASSLGAPVTALSINLGSTQNSGHELQATAVLIDSKKVNWEVTGSFSHNDNKWVELGIDPATGNERIIGAGTATQQRQNLPLFGQWYRNYTYADANHDGIIQQGEVQVDTALSFHGIGFAKDLASISTGLDFFSRKLHINALFDYKGGGNVLESNYFQCSSAPKACRETQDPTSPIELQARAVAVTYGSKTGGTTYTTRAGYFVPAQYWKFRELSAVVSLPDMITSRLRADNGSTFVIGARNLRTWTSFTGVDPEESYSVNGSEVQNDFNSSPPPTYFTFRLNLKY